MSFLDNLENNLKSLESAEQAQDEAERRHKNREAELAQARAAAPHADALKNGPFTAELLKQASRIGFSMRTKRTGREAAGVTAGFERFWMVLGAPAAVRAVSMPMMSYTLRIESTPTPSDTQSGLASSGGFLSRITAGNGLRGWAASASVTMTPSTGAMTGRMVFSAGVNIQML